jgi:hypothetical protein
MAVDATGTPTTNYSIPKFNTAVDAPSGKGGNAQADFIDNLLKTTFVSAPVGVVTSEVLVYNGTSWDRSSVTKLTANNNIKFDGYSTSLPGSPYDGQVYTLVDSTTTPTYQWTFRYNAGSSSSFKWEFVGGAPAYAAVETAQTTASAAPVRPGDRGAFIHGAEGWRLSDSVWSARRREHRRPVAPTSSYADEGRRRSSTGWRNSSSAVQLARQRRCAKSC